MGGASSKTVLADIAHLLITKEIDPADHVFWDELWKLNLPSEELFTVVNHFSNKFMIDYSKELF